MITRKDKVKSVRRKLSERINASHGKEKADLIQIRKAFVKEFKRMKSALDDAKKRKKIAKKYSKIQMSNEKYDKFYCQLQAVAHQSQNEAVALWQDVIEDYCNSVLLWIDGLTTS